MSSSPDLFFLNPPSIIIDDFDPEIRYSGTWHIANETEILTSKLVPERMPYFNTLHVLNIYSGSFSYSFTGAGISVFATPYDNSDYTSQCFLDGIQLSFDPNSTTAQFGQSQPVCQAFGLPDNIVHTISFNVSVPPRQQQDQAGPLSGFAFDYMLIEPPSGLSPWDNGTQDVLLPILATQGIESTANPTLNFEILLDDPSRKIASVSRGWKFDAEHGFNATTEGSQFNLTFIGTSVWWYGYFPQDVPSIEAFNPAVKFSIDGGIPSNFSDILIPLSASQGFLFKTPVLQYGMHLLTVKATPTVSSSTMGSLPSTTTSISSTSLSLGQRGNLRGIVGGIPGGVICVLLVASTVFVLMRRVKRRQKSMQTYQNGATISLEPFPVTTEQTVGIIAPRKAQVNQQNIDNPFMQQELQAPPLTKWTRGHIISGSPGSSLGSSTSTIQHQAAVDSRNNNPLIQSDGETRPANTGSVDNHPAVPMGGALNPTALDIPISTILPAEQVEREEDSGVRMAYVPVLPPLYTTH